MRRGGILPDQGVLPGHVSGAVKSERAEVAFPLPPGGCWQGDFSLPADLQTFMKATPGFRENAYFL